MSRSFVIHKPDYEKSVNAGTHCEGAPKHSDRTNDVIHGIFPFVLRFLQASHFQRLPAAVRIKPSVHVARQYWHSFNGCLFCTAHGFQVVDVQMAADAEATLPALIEAVRQAIPNERKAAIEKIVTEVIEGAQSQW